MHISYLDSTLFVEGVDFLCSTEITCVFIGDHNCVYITLLTSPPGSSTHRVCLSVRPSARLSATVLAGTTGT